MTEISEIPQTPLEAQLLNDAREVRDGIKKIEELTEIKYVPGFENKVGFFPILESLPGQPLLARFSYGSEAPNMSAVFFDAAKGETPESGTKNTQDFLESQGFTGPTIQVLGKYDKGELQIEEVDKDTLKEKIKVIGNVIYTRDPDIVLTIKPADCPTGVIYCVDDNGNDVAAIIHGGAEAVNTGLIRQGLQALQIELGVDLKEARLAVFPGVSLDNYFISRQWMDATGNIVKKESGIYPMNWGEYIKEQKTDDPEEKRYVNISSAYEMQALQAGMDPENIQLYRVDTYADAEEGKAYSRRYSSDHKGERPGGQIIAAQLKPKIAEENPVEFQKAA